jgi:integrase
VLSTRKIFKAARGKPNVPKQITASLCTRRVTKQTKIFDTKCPGFYVSVAASGTATFAFKYWNKKAEKQDTVTIGPYHPEHLTVEHARAQAFDMRGRIGRGEDIKQSASHAKAQAKVSGVTVNQIIDEFIAYIKTPVVKADGEKRPRIESWKNIDGFLNNNARGPIGNKMAAEVTNNDIASIQATVAKRSTSSARQTRSALNRLFKWAAEAGRSYVTASPCFNLPSLDKEYERARVLTPEEIRAFWWGLDDPDLPCTRSIALALKFELVSMLRSQELRTARRSELKGLHTGNAVLRVPLKFVKKRRVILQPLNSLAVEIIKEAMATHNHDIIFASRALEEPMLNRSALNHALAGKHGKVKRDGILDFLGLEKFTPHDLRRTAATLAGDLGFTDAEISKCLDHSKDRGEDIVEAPTVTGRVYVKSKRLDEKRKVLDAIDAALREIIGPCPAKLRKVA